MYIEDVYFLHEVDNYLYGYFNNIAYEFDKNSFEVTNKGCVSFDIDDPGNPLFYCMKYKSFFLSVLGNNVYKLYKWGIQHYYTLPFEMQPKNAIIHQDHIVFSNNYALKIENKQIVQNYAEFPVDSTIFQYHNYFSINNTGNFVVYDNNLKEIQYIVLELKPLLTTLVKNIAVLSNGKTSFILDLSSIPIKVIQCNYSPKLNYAFIYFNQGLKFRSPLLSRKVNHENFCDYVKLIDIQTSERFQTNQYVIDYDQIPIHVKNEDQSQINERLSSKIQINECQNHANEVDIWAIRKQMNEMFEDLNAMKIQSKKDKETINILENRLTQCEKTQTDQKDEIKRLRIRVIEL